MCDKTTLEPICLGEEEECVCLCVGARIVFLCNDATKFTLTTEGLNGLRH